MKVSGLSLVATVPTGTLSHPVTSVEDVTRVFGWLSPHLPDAVWTIEEAA